VNDTVRASLRNAAVLFGLLGIILPSVSAETVRFAHCLGGCPLGAPADNQVVARSLYTLSFNTDNRVADWVAYVVTSGSIGVATNLSRRPERDPFVTTTLELPENTPSETGDDQLQLHPFTPLVSFAGTPYWREVNYLTNLAPRTSGLNRGSWYGLEWAVRNLANRSDGLYVITGPIYERGKIQQRLPIAVPHQVPSGFFKVVADVRGRVAVFTFDQDLPFHVHHCEQRTTLGEVEALTGLDLFPELPDWPLDDLSRDLGCF